MKLYLNIIFFFIYVGLFTSNSGGIPYQAVLLSQENAQELPVYDSDYANLLTNSLVSIRFFIINSFGFIHFLTATVVQPDCL